MAALPARWCLALLLLTMLVANLLSNRVLPDADVVVGLAFTGCLLLLARMGGLTVDDLGLSRTSWRPGLTWGLGAAGCVAIGYGVALVVPPLRESLTTTAGRSLGQVLVASLVVIPLGTVLPEELAFRGVLWGLLRRERGPRVATLVSSALFGVWHVLPSLGGGPANEAVADVVGNGDLGTVLRVAATLLFTSAAGVLLCELRRRSGSLLAPILLHWAVNGLGVVSVYLA